MVFHLSLDLRDNISIFRTVTFLTLENPLITQRNSKLYYALELGFQSARESETSTLIKLSRQWPLNKPKIVLVLSPIEYFEYLHIYDTNLLLFWLQNVLGPRTEWSASLVPHLTSEVAIAV